MHCTALQSPEREDEYKDRVGLLMLQMYHGFLFYPAIQFYLIVSDFLELRNAQPSKMSRKVMAKPLDPGE